MEEIGQFLRLLPATTDNKTLHLTAISLRYIAAGELGRWETNKYPFLMRGDV